MLLLGGGVGGLFCVLLEYLGGIGGGKEPLPSFFGKLDSVEI